MPSVLAYATAMLDPYDPAAFRDTAHAVVDLLADHLVAMNAADTSVPVLPHTTARESVARWSERLKTTGDPAALFAEIIERSHHLHHPGYAGHQVACPFPLGAIADLVASLLNNGLAIYEMGPVGLATERACVRWMCDTLALPPGAEGVFVSGGSLGNLTALLAARQAKSGWDAWGEGAHAGPPPAVLVSEQAHYCIARAAQVMGFGAGGVIPVRTDETFKVSAETLAEAHAGALAAGRAPIAVVASSCTTSTGAYDPIPVVADFAEANDLWLHVDGAHGASAAISPAHSHKLAGVERADSVVWDAHKLLAVPSLSTAVLFREGRRSHEAFAQEASYLFDTGVHDNWWDGGRRTLECTRRTLALPLYALLACFGENALVEHVDRLHLRATEFAELLRGEPDFEPAHEPESNIVCFRYTPKGASDLDALQARVRAGVVESGEFYLVRATLRGSVYLRTTLMNPRTSINDLRRLLVAIRRAGVPTGASPPPRSPA